MVGRRSVDDSLLNSDEVAEGEVGRTHGDLLCLWVDVRRLKNLGGVLATHHGEEPFWCSLLAGYESFGSQLGKR